MMPVWIFAVFIVLFAVVIIWERFSLKALQDEYKNVEFFLNLYIDKYGQLDGMVIVEEGSDADKK
jgi:hypothetical protein